MKKVLIIICILFSSFLVFSNKAKDQFMNNVFYNFNDMVDMFALDYSKITGLYTAGGEIIGSASVGHFPSFRAGTTVGTIFFRDPLRFIKGIDFFGVTWDDAMDAVEKKNMKGAVDFFDQNFLPIPVTYFHFHIGLPHGLTVGVKFSVGPLAPFVKSVAPATATYLNDFTYWSIGANMKYTIMRDHKYFPNMSVGMGIQYSDTVFDITNIPIGELTLDESNDAIPSYFNFYSHNQNTAFYVDFNISKRIKFFQPYAGFKLVQTINHNLTKIIIDIDLSNATSDAKSTYSSRVVISNKTDQDAYNNEIGYIIPVTDFILSAGFEFIISIFRMGIEGSFACASQTGMLTVGLRLQMEDWQFKKFGKRRKKE